MTVYLPNGRRGVVEFRGRYAYLVVPGRQDVKLHPVGSKELAQWIKEHTR